MSHDVLIEYLENDLSFDEKDKADIERYFTLRRIKKKHFLHREGEVCKYNCFVVSGALRCFMMDDSFKEHNTQFAFENWWITDFGSFLKKEKSRMNIQALEDSVVLMISSDDQNEMLNTNPKLCRIFREKLQMALCAAHERILNNIAFTAKDRYEEFLKQYPNYINRISDQHIASYIGVTPVFYSKMKKQLLREYLNLD